jgi:hypothetical protein
LQIVMKRVKGDVRHVSPSNGWMKSSRCDSGACVEVLLGDTVVGVRNSTSPAGANLWFGREQWQAFVADLRAGRLDPS